MKRMLVALLLVPLVIGCGSNRCEKDPTDPACGNTRTSTQQQTTRRGPTYSPSGGYDPYGSGGYDPYAGGGYDPYGGGGYDPYAGGGYDPYAGGGYDPYGQQSPYGY